jgi:hypothetical protein
MRYEAKSEREAVEGAARALGRSEAELKYTVIRDEKSFWGGRVVEIEVEDGGKAEPGAGSREPGAGSRMDELAPVSRKPGAGEAIPGSRRPPR